MIRSALPFALLLLSTIAHAQNIDSNGPATAPSGTAGGVLSGTYPNPGFAATPTFVTPVLGVATGTSVALSGCTISTNKLCVTGTENISGTSTIGSGSTDAVTIAGGAAGGTVSTTAGTLTLASGGATTTTLSDSNVTLSGAGTLTLTQVASSGSALSYVCINTGTKVVSFGAAAGLCTTSTEERKDISSIIPPREALAETLLLRPIWFKYKDSETGTFDHAVHAGFGAHQVEGVDTRLTAYSPEGNLAGVRYMEMSALLVAAIQEQQVEIAELKRRIGRLEK